jgi:hypothetical protein
VAAGIAAVFEHGFGDFSVSETVPGATAGGPSFQTWGHDSRLALIQSPISGFQSLNARASHVVEVDQRGRSARVAQFAPLSDFGEKDPQARKKK